MIQQATTRAVRSVEDAYYQGNAYWIVSFADDAFTILSATGRPLEPGAAEVLRPLVEGALPVREYVDLAAETEALARRELIARAVLAELLQGAPVPPLETLANTVENASEEEVSAAIEALKSAGWLWGGADPQDPRQVFVNGAQAEVVDMYRFVLRKPVPPSVVTLFGSEAHTRNVREHLVPAIIEFHYLHFDETEREDVEKMLRWSPSALNWALQAQEFLIHSRPGEAWGATEQDRVERIRTRFFLRRLMERMQADLTKPATTGLFLRSHGIHKFEFTEHVVVHGRDGVQFERTLTERLQLVELADGYVGPGGADVAPVIEIEREDGPDAPDGPDGPKQ